MRLVFVHENWASTNMARRLGRGPHKEQLARAHGLVVVHTATEADLLGRPGGSWTQVALRLPDDGTGALPLLRHAILNDQKSATYKLGLLRALCRAADGAAGLAQDTEGDHVAVPLGLVAYSTHREQPFHAIVGASSTPSRAG
jgi:hypothetical protein